MRQQTLQYQELTRTELKHRA